jgi:hypothetical protein
VASLPEPFCDSHINAHVEQQARSGGSGVVNLFLRKPGRVLDRLLDIRVFQVGIALEDLVERSTVSDLADDHGPRRSLAAQG